MVAVASNYPGGFNNGVSVRGLPILNTYGGNVFWVDSGSGSNATGNGTYNKPFASIDYAIGRCTANNGDYVYVKPGHVEDITAASGIDFDVAGITVVGLGSGTDMPRIDWEAAASTMVVDAANTRLVNLHLVASFANVTQMVDVGAFAGFEMHSCWVEDEGANLNWLRAIDTNGATELKLIGNKFIGRSTDNNEMVFFDIATDDIEIIGNSFISTAVQTATVALIDADAALTAAVIANNILVSQSATVTGALVDTSAVSTNTGMFAYNLGGVLDTDAAATQFPWDVTGMHMVENYVCDTVDTQGWLNPVIGATG